MNTNTKNSENSSIIRYFSSENLLYFFHLSLPLLRPLAKNTCIVFMQRSINHEQNMKRFEKLFISTSRNLQNLSSVSIKRPFFKRAPFYITRSFKCANETLWKKYEIEKFSGNHFSIDFMHTCLIILQIL